MRSFLLLAAVLMVVSGCALQIQPAGDGVSRCQSSDGSACIYFDARNGIIWASTQPGPGTQFGIYPAGESRYLYKFGLGGNDTHFERMPINFGDEFLVVVGRESLSVIVTDTILPDFYRVQFPEVVVDFDLSLGRIYYHNIHQETFKVRITDLTHGIFLVDEKEVRCYESRMARVSNLEREREYGVKVSQDNKGVRYEEIVLQ
jgi:hypothetical protein